MSKKLLIIVSVALSLIGCAAQEINRADIRLDPAQATIVGWGTSAGEILQNSIALPLGTSIDSLYVTKINGNPVNSQSNVTKLAAGEHELTIACRIRLDGMRSFSDSIIKVKVNAGRIYELKGGQISAVQTRPPTILCNPSAVDATDKYTASK